jgi:phosphoribosyl 1,2-cyclic phosphate phosphodiesterase
MKLLVLGCGTSTGVPRIGNDWGECDPERTEKRRSRVSIMVESEEGARLLVDTSTDLRQQLLDNGIDKVDAVFWTHDHADHCHGIDDLRPMRFSRNAPLPGFASAQTARSLRQRFSYVFSGATATDDRPPRNARAREDPRRVRDRVGRMPHGPTASTGFRFEADGKAIAYATDFSEITDEMVALFNGVDILVTDCLRREPHPTHASLATALELHTRCKAQITVLTHLDKSMDYATLSAECRRASGSASMDGAGRMSQYGWVSLVAMTAG